MHEKRRVDIESYLSGLFYWHSFQPPTPTWWCCTDINHKVTLNSLSTSSLDQWLDCTTSTATLLLCPNRHSVVNSPYFGQCFISCVALDRCYGSCSDVISIEPTFQFWFLSYSNSKCPLLPKTYTYSKNPKFEHPLESKWGLNKLLWKFSRAPRKCTLQH